MSDLAGLLKELEEVAKDTNIKEVKNKSLEESVASKDNVSSLFEGLEAAYTETRIEEEIANRLSEEDEQKLGAFSGFMESVTELTNQSNSQKAIEELFATVAPPQLPVEVSVESVDESVDEEIVEEPIEAKEADTIIQQIVSSLDDMGEKTEVKEQVDQISKLRDEFNNFRALMQQQVLSHTPGSGEVKLEFLDDVERSTAKVDGKFLKYSSSDSKWIGADASGESAADDLSAGDAAVTITTTSGDITIDAAANNSDIILKGTDGGVDTTFLTIDGSAAGKSTFNNEIVSGAVITSGAGIVIADAGNIGSASDTDAIAIASDGVVTMDQIPVFSAGINVSGGTIAGTLATVAQGNITSLGTLTALTVDNVVINGATIGHTDDTDLITLSDGAVTVAGNLTVSGTTTTVNQTVVNVTDAFVFEGANADEHETTFRVDEPTADRKASLQNKTGTIALLSGFKLNATDGSASNDGDFIVLNTSADENDRLLFEDGTSDPLSVLASHGITLVGQGWNAFRFDNSI